MPLFRKIFYISTSDARIFTFQHAVSKLQLATECISFPNGQVALDYLTGCYGNGLPHRPAGVDWMVSGSYLPVLNGFELLREFYRLKQRVPLPVAFSLMPVEQTPDQLADHFHIPREDFKQSNFGLPVVLPDWPGEDTLLRLLGGFSPGT